jgi:SAM-dependent methyltransferase
MKDLFSHDPAGYATFRPSYPAEIFTRLSELCKTHQAALDVGTGNGQIARELARNFNRVEATDISAQQLKAAFHAPNIQYSLQPAEQTDFHDSSFDLITVGQAIHWFDFERFYKEVKRILKPEGVFAVLGYGLIKINPEIDQVIQKLYSNILGDFWDPERKYIDEHYRTIPFPFEELPFPVFENRQNWTLDHLLGYLKTWSAVKNYMNRKGTDPLELVRKEIDTAWGKEKMRVISFPLLIRVGTSRRPLDRSGEV